MLLLPGSPVQVGSYSATAPTTISLSVSSANAGPLSARTIYRLWSSVDAFFLFGPDNTVTATTSSHPIKAGLDLLHLVPNDTNLYVAAIVSSGTGVFYVSEYKVGF